MKSFAVICILLASALMPLRAQNFGELTGTVSDATGAILAGASVTAVNNATSQARQATTNDTGTYSVPYLVPGNYDLRIEHPGFKTATRKAAPSMSAL